MNAIPGWSFTSAMKIGDARNHRRDQHRVDAHVDRAGDLPLHAGEIAGEARRISRRRAVPPDRAETCGNGLHPFRERRIGLIGQAMIVLDVVDASLCKTGGKIGERGRRQSLRLERRAGQRAMRRSRSLSQSLHAMARTAERRTQPGRQVDVPQDDIVVQRAVAEQHVQQLAGIVIHGRRRQRNRDIEQAGHDLSNRFDASDDFRQDKVVGDRRQWHFDALLDRERTGARVDRPRVATDAIDSY